MSKTGKKEVKQVFSSLCELSPDYKYGRHNAPLLLKWAEETFGVLDYNIDNPNSFFNGERSIDNQIEILSAIQKAAKNIGWENVTLVYDRSYDDEYDSISYELKICVFRMETDKEYEARKKKSLEKSKKAKVAAKARKEQQEKEQEEKERKLLTELKKKYENP